MNIHFGFTLGVMFVFLLIWLIPFILVVKSTKTNGSEKLGWLFAMLFISWFAWVLYLLWAPLKPKVSGV